MTVRGLGGALRITITDETQAFARDDGADASGMADVVLAVPREPWSGSVAGVIRVPYTLEMSSIMTAGRRQVARDFAQ